MTDLLDRPAAARGMASYAADGSLLDCYFPHPALGGQATEIPGLDPELSRHDELRGVTTRAITTRIDSLADQPVDTAEVWLRLHLLSHRVIQPRQANLDGLFGLLANVAWTSLGPVAAPDLDAVRLACRLAGQPIAVREIDKLPYLLDYVTPAGVRIADASRVRLGAHLSPGTTVMPSGFVNFNAGTLGTSMVEGRISAGVVVGDGSDVGGGASIMGVLSGGGKEIVRIGERCLIGANGGVGISLGDDCVVEAGCYVTAGSKVTLPDGRVVAARELSGLPGLTFWRNSATGVMEARPRDSAWGALNAALHAQ